MNQVVLLRIDGDRSVTEGWILHLSLILIEIDGNAKIGISYKSWVDYLILFWSVVYT